MTMGFLTIISTFCGGISSTTWMILGISALISIGALWFHHNEAQLQLKSSEITALQISDAAQKQAIAQAATDAATIQSIDSSLSAIQQANFNQALVLANALAKLDAAAVLNPALVEAKINKASDNRNRCLALVTGAPLLKDETNPVCPQVLPKVK